VRLNFCFCVVFSKNLIYIFIYLYILYMSTQIFKKKVPNEFLFNLLDSICMKNEKHYILNSNSFKKGIFNQTIPTFLQECKLYYHISKRKYLERKLAYNSFTTIIRQICNFNKITYTSQIKYDKSTYDIVYYIYY
jgi:hypothetical protein